MIVDSAGKCWVCGGGFGRRWSVITLPSHFPSTFSFVGCGQDGWCLIPEGVGGLVYRMGSGEVRYEARDIRFADCAAGTYHFVAVAQDGRVFSFGRRKACGQGRKFGSDTPRAVAGFDRISRCFAYGAASFLIDYDGIVWASGRNDRGQTGLGDTAKSNRFKALPPFPEAVTHLGVGAVSAHFLRESGQLFGCGAGATFRLFIGSEDSVRVPRAADMTGALRFSWLSVGCSSVVAQAEGISILPHPLVVQMARLICPPFSVRMGGSVVDVSFAARSAAGCSPGDSVTVTGREFRFAGGAAGDRVLLLSGSGGTCVLPRSDFVCAQAVDGIRTRGGNSERMRRGVGDLAPFGLRAEEAVAHPDFGEGAVIGAARGRVWFQWAGDESATTAAKCEAVALCRYLSVSQPAGRSVVRMAVCGGPVNVEVAPCARLSDCGLAVGDIVRRSGGAFAVVRGELACRAVVSDVADGRTALAAIAELSLIGRPNGTASVTARDFSGAVVDLEVGFAVGSAVIPGDRVLTEKGLATVAGVEEGALWIQADRATRLNAGLLRYSGGARLVRRLLSLRAVAGILAGDIVAVGGRRFLARVGGEGEGEGEVVLEAVENAAEIIREAEIEAAGPTLVLRPDLPGAVLLGLRGGMTGEFRVSTAGFRGKRGMPGDTIECGGERFGVLGERGDGVWVAPVGETPMRAVQLQPQALLDPQAVRIVEFADGGIAYPGK
jgi:hypothetical protein